MKLYDISQELFHGRVYPGDPAPEYERILKITEGAPCNLTKFNMGAHNATHLDAPYHFYENGITVEQIDLVRCVGPCTVISLSDYTLEELQKVLKVCNKRLLIKGKDTVTLEHAKLFNNYGILLVGVEGQSVGPEDAPIPVHLELLGKEVVLLEGLVLDEIVPGNYFLSAAPIKLGKCDGAPCRAILLDFDETATCNS
ncbi:cyclase family protein [Mobilitalea sibirica]|uniref:Cyclase family protein n=1 Tax=Mobilitalea sibirica TaxID=1462919 RepID=A0A8J7KWY3_9FIRM|nr:cyclase family protein [Mobilitalea sibirica]MBH1941875.1 cyclase family protein [Mobilitalea sibirica]